MPDARELSYSECEALLRAGVAGREALMTPTGPQIVPLNYSEVDSAIVVRTAPAGILGRHGPGAIVAFEVDHFHHAYQQGWSVVARGRADVVQEAAALRHIRSVWEPRPWASGARPMFLRIAWTELTGRQLGTGWDPLREQPHRRVV